MHERCGEVCGDSRFEIIENAKRRLLRETNIESSPKEMEVLDDFLFRCWQMGWLKSDPSIGPGGESSEKKIHRLETKVREMELERADENYWKRNEIR